MEEKVFIDVTMNVAVSNNFKLFYISSVPHLQPALWISF